MTVTLTHLELAATVAAAVALAATDAAALSRLAVTVVAKRLGVKPRDIYRFDAATSGDAEPEGGRND
jgi:hypothetical protein